ncbi:hypothetical protein KI387_042846, partial [Taxus chinensis]
NGCKNMVRGQQSHPELHALQICSKPQQSPSQEEGQLETINTWELMEGLEDNTGSSPLVVVNEIAMKKSVDRTLDRSFSFHSVKDVEQLARDEPKRSVWHRVTPGVKLADEKLKFSSKAMEEAGGRS